MMILTNNQKMYLRGNATVALERMKLFSKGEKINLEDGYQVSLLAQYLEEACGMGYSIALDEVRSTPWEYISQPILMDAAKNDRIMNEMASNGWDLHMVTSGWLFWRRRKAVAQIAAEFKVAAEFELK
jgi:hypothetical protein